MTVTGAKVGRPRNPPQPPKPEAFEAPEFADQLSAILEGLEAPPIDKETRSTLLRYLHRRQKFGDLFRDEWGSDGVGYVTVLVRTIVESTGNENALIEPIVVAVGRCMRPIWTARDLGWVAAFDNIPLLDTYNKLRDLDLFNDKELLHFYEKSIRRKLWQIFGPDVVPAAPQVKAPKKPPAHVTRVPVIENRIQLGLQLLELRSKAKWNNEFSALRKKHFPDLETLQACEMMKVAKVYAARPEIYRSCSWQTLVELASPRLAGSARTRLETTIIAGKEVRARDVRNARSRRCGARQRAPILQAAA